MTRPAAGPPSTPGPAHPHRFFGLDDVFTERPEVRAGMIDIFQKWITDYDIDGSRIDATEQVEYVVAVNNSTGQQTANVRTYSANTPFLKVYPTGNETLDSSGSKDLAVTVPPLSAVVYKAAVPLAKSAAAPPVSLTLLPGGRLTGRAPIGATVAGDGFNQVTFAVKVGNSSQWTLLGTDNAGHTSVSQPVTQTVGARPAPAPTTPPPTNPAPTPTPSR